MTLPIGPGVLVDHVLWGPGKVIEVNPPHFVAYFPSLEGTMQGPRRKLQLAASQIAVSAVQSSPTLDRIHVGRPKTRKAAGGMAPKRPTFAGRSLSEAIDWFQQTYPGLFMDAALHRDELEYKRNANHRAVELFGDGRGRALLETGQLGEIAVGLDELYNATNIPSRFEIMAIHDGLKDPGAAARLLDAILNLSDSPNASTFEALCAAVSSLPAPVGGSRVLTWPNVTIIPFLLDPRRLMVLKPEISQAMAARSAIELLYSSAPRWHCYEALHRMSESLLEELKPFGAKDFIDVQSFMWVTREI